MGNDAALAEEAPLSVESFPYWVLFIILVVVVTLVSSVLIATTDLLSRSSAPLRRSVA
jgi:hypothetical protein